jgi:hypothetical protein
MRRRSLINEPIKDVTIAIPSITTNVLFLLRLKPNCIFNPRHEPVLNEHDTRGEPRAARAQKN